MGYEIDGLQTLALSGMLGADIRQAHNDTGIAFMTQTQGGQ